MKSPVGAVRHTSHGGRIEGEVVDASTGKLRSAPPRCPHALNIDAAHRFPLETPPWRRRISAGW